MARVKVGPSLVIEKSRKATRRLEGRIARRFLARARRFAAREYRRIGGASITNREHAALWRVVVASIRSGLLVLLLVTGFVRPVAAGPLRETVKWSAWQAAGQLGGDHLSSWYVDNVSRRCVENNPMLRAADGSYAVGRGWAFNGVGIGLAASAIYLGKRFHRPTLERVGKAGSVWGAASGAWFGVHNWAGCSGR